MSYIKEKIEDNLDIFLMVLLLASSLYYGKYKDPTIINIHVMYTLVVIMVSFVVILMVFCIWYFFSKSIVDYLLLTFRVMLIWVIIHNLFFKINYLFKEKDLKKIRVKTIEITQSAPNAKKTINFIEGRNEYAFSIEKNKISGNIQVNTEIILIVQNGGLGCKIVDRVER